MILDVTERWGAVDRSHRKLAHRGSYQQLVWVSPSSFRRVLVEHGRHPALNRSPVAVASAGRGRTGWCGRRTESGFGTSRISPGPGGSGFAIVDVVSRKWIETVGLGWRKPPPRCRLIPPSARWQIEGLETRPAHDDSSASISTRTTRARPILLAVSEQRGPPMTGSKQPARSWR